MFESMFNDKGIVFHIMMIIVNPDSFTFLWAIRSKMHIKNLIHVFQVVLKGDNSTQLVQDDQVKGPLRVCILCAFWFS